MKAFIVLAALVAAVAAEADPQLLYGGLGYGYAGLGYAGLGYAGLAAPYAYAVGKSAPCVNAANIPVPCADGYLGYAGTHLIGKREAEAEADPALLYSGLGYAGHLGYAGALPYAGHAYAYGALPYVHSSLVGVCTNYLGAQVPC